jgi:hypothetical protein
MGSHRRSIRVTPSHSESLRVTLGPLNCWGPGWRLDRAGRPADAGACACAYYRPAGSLRGALGARASGGGEAIKLVVCACVAAAGGAGGGGGGGGGAPPSPSLSDCDARGVRGQPPSAAAPAVGLP